MKFRLVSPLSSPRLAALRSASVHIGLMTAMCCFCLAGQLPASAGTFHRIAAFNNQNLSVTVTGPSPDGSYVETATLNVPKALPTGTLVVVATFSDEPNSLGIGSDSENGTYTQAAYAVHEGPLDNYPFCNITFKVLTTALSTSDKLTITSTNMTG